MSISSTLTNLVQQVLEDLAIIFNTNYQGFSPSYILLWSKDKWLRVVGLVGGLGWIGQLLLATIILAIWLILALRINNRIFPTTRLVSNERMEDKTVLVTGFNRGVGLLVAKEMAARGATLILACRNLQKGERALQEIRSATKSSRLNLARLDLSDMSSVRHFANQILASQTKLHVLICNGSVSLSRLYKTETGLEVHFATNYLGFFLLSNLLLTLLSTSGGRILLPVYKAAWSAQLEAHNFNSELSFQPKTAFANSQLANLLLARTLSTRCQSAGLAVTVNCFDKGVHGNGRLLSRLTGSAGSAAGAETAVHLAVSSDGRHYSGEYFSGCRRAGVPPLALDEKLASLLWDFSCFCTNLEPDENGQHQEMTL